MPSDSLNLPSTSHAEEVRNSSEKYVSVKRFHGFQENAWTFHFSSGNTDWLLETLAFSDILKPGGFEM